MYALDGTIKELNIDYQTGKALLTLSVNQKQTAINCFNELKDREKLTFKIGRYTESRTNDANRYFWALCEKLAEKLNTTKMDIYIDSIKEVGVFYDDEIEIEKVQRRRTAWSMIGTGWLKVCYITGTTYNLHKHHIYFGNPNRQISEDNGFWVYLTGRLHNQSNDGVHGKNGRQLDLFLKQECQRKFEETHSRAEFMALIGKNYL